MALVMNEEAVDLKLDVADRTYKAGKTAISSDEQDAEGLSFKVPIGRPSKYHPDHCKAVLDLGSRGKSLAQMASYFNVEQVHIERMSFNNFLESKTIPPQGVPLTLAAHP